MKIVPKKTTNFFKKGQSNIAEDQKKKILIAFKVPEVSLQFDPTHIMQLHRPCIGTIFP